MMTLTRQFTRAELVQIAYDYVAAGGAASSMETAEALVDDAADSMLGRVEVVGSAERGDEREVPDEREVDEGDYAIVRDAIVAALSAEDLCE
jgi:hypothetical protein